MRTDPINAPKSTPKAGESKATAEEDRPLAVATHLLSLVSPLIGPGIVWLVVGSPTVKAHAKEAVNTALTFLLIYVLLALLALFGGLLSLGGSTLEGLMVAGGVLLALLVLPAVYLVLGIVAAVMAGQGEFFRPKLILRIL